MSTMIPVDQTVDLNSQVLHRLAARYGLPDYAKQASVKQAGMTGRQDCPQHLFADPVNLRFPCHTGPSTYISGLYFMDQKGQMGGRAHEIEKRIKTSAQHFGIDRDLLSIEKRHEELTKSADTLLPDEAFGHVVTRPDGTRDRYLRMKDAQEVLRAVNYLADYTPSMSRTGRAVLAGRILDRAGQLGVELEKSAHVKLEQAAGRGFADPRQAAQLLYDRGRYLHGRGKSEKAASILQAADMCLKKGQLTKEAADAVASMIMDLDRVYGIQGLGTADDIYSVTDKEAQDLAGQHVELATGTCYRRQDLESLSLDLLRGQLGDEFAEKVSTGGLFLDREKFAACLPELSRHDALMFDRLVESVGVKPAVPSAR